MTKIVNWNRNTSSDLVWNSSTNSYEPASTPATSGFLTDGNGNIFLFNGKAIYIYEEEESSGVETEETITVTIQVSGSPWVTGSYATIGEETYTNLTSGNEYEFEAILGNSYTLRVVNSGRRTNIFDSNDTRLTPDYNDDVSYTFTATENVTYRIDADIEKTS